MKNIFLVIVLMSIIAVSCQKESDPTKVDYMITGLTDSYEVVYLDNKGVSISQTIIPSGPSSKWVQSFEMYQGDPVYLYLKFKEDISSSMSFSMGIIVNSKYEYQAKYY